MASDELTVVAGPRLGGENRLGRRASQHEAFEALGSFLLPCAVTRVSLLAVGCLRGATPRGQPWTPTVTLPQGRHGLRAWRMAVLSPFRELSLCRHVHHELWRSVLLDSTPIIAATTCHQRSYVERYSRAIVGFARGAYDRHRRSPGQGRSAPHRPMAALDAAGDGDGLASGTPMADLY